MNLRTHLSLTRLTQQNKEKMSRFSSAKKLHVWLEKLKIPGSPVQRTFCAFFIQS